MRRLLLAVVLLALIPTTAQARYLHAAEAVRVVVHENRQDQREGIAGDFQILRTERRNARGVDVWIRLTNFDGFGVVLQEWDINEHVRLFSDGLVTSHMDAFDYRYREWLR